MSLVSIEAGKGSQFTEALCDWKLTELYRVDCFAMRRTGVLNCVLKI